MHVQAGVIPDDAPVGVQLAALFGHLREQAAGRASAGELDLVSERARLAKEQADRVAMENARMRRELAPVALLETVLAQIGRQIAGILEAVPVTLRRRAKSLTTEDLELINAELVKARNLAAGVELDWEDIDGPDGDHPSDPLRAKVA
jgi:phage terminase Nu1 subunit (DNA packaging protein)